MRATTNSREEEVEDLVVVVKEDALCALHTLSLVLLNLRLENMLVEEVVQALVGEVDAHLVKPAKGRPKTKIKRGGA